MLVTQRRINTSWLEHFEPGAGVVAPGSLALGEIALACGFASASHFTNRFRQTLGATPGEYRAAFRPLTPQNSSVLATETCRESP